MTYSSIPPQDPSQPPAARRHPAQQRPACRAFSLVIDVDGPNANSVRVLDRCGRVVVDISQVPIAALLRFCLLPRHLARSGCFDCDVHLARRLILANLMLNRCVRVVG